MVDKRPSEVTLEGAEPQPGKWPKPTLLSDEDKQIYPGAGSELFHGIKKTP
jgi:hypothetical protein